MREVAIIGAGELGGAIAHGLARRDIVQSIRLVDVRGDVAAGKALDIAQAAPVEGFTTALSGATDVAVAAGASVIVLADRVGAGEWQGEEALQLVQRIAKSAPDAILVCAGASQRELVERGARELRMPRHRLLGSAPEALASAARAMVALAIDGSPRDIALSVLGVPPSHTVIAWTDATVAGFALTRLVDDPTRRRLHARIVALWPPGPQALAAAAVKALEAIADRGRRLVSAFVPPDTALGTRTRTAALPVRLGPSGIAEVVLPTLSSAERVALDNAMTL
jgi:malate dehydrogenase